MMLSVLIGVSFAFSTGADPSKEAVEAELKKFVGTWKTTASVVDGATSDKDRFVDLTTVISADGKFVVKYKDSVVGKGSIKPNPTTKPLSFDMTYSEIQEFDGKFGKEIKSLGIYEWDGDNLKSCQTRQHGPMIRPKEFESKKGANLVLETRKRIKP